MENNWIRDYNYLQDFYFTQYQYYNTAYRAFPVTYYSMDRENSIWEDEALMAGSYEKLGVGDWSGVKWKKILYLPVYGIQQVQPNVDNGEKGQNYSQSMTTEMSFPQSYGLNPIEGDVVDINFGLDSSSLNISPLFVVTNKNLSHHGNTDQIFQCKLSVAPFNIVQIDNQISAYYIFISSDNKIYPLENGTVILRLEQRMKSLADSSTNLYDNSSGFYLRRME